MQQFEVFIAIVQILHGRIRRYGHWGIGIDSTVGKGEIGRKSPGLVFIAAVVEREYDFVRILVVRTVSVEYLGIIGQQSVVAGLDSDGCKRLPGHRQVVVAAVLHRIHPQRVFGLEHVDGIRGSQVFIRSETACIFDSQIDVGPDLGVYRGFGRTARIGFGLCDRLDGIQVQRNVAP